MQQRPGGLWTLCESAAIPLSPVAGRRSIWFLRTDREIPGQIVWAAVNRGVGGAGSERNGEKTGRDGPPDGR